MSIYPSYRRVYTSRPLLTSYTVCEDDYAKTQINDIPLLFLCEKDVVETTTVPTNAATTETSTPTEAPSQASTKPTEGTVASAAPTNSAGLPECPPNSDTYQRSYYVYSSL